MPPKPPVPPPAPAKSPAPLPAASTPKPQEKREKIEPLDLNKIILPQKNAGPSPLSASRASAAEVLKAADEALQSAKSHAPKGHAPEPIPKPIEPQRAPDHLPMAPKPATPPPAPKPKPTPAAPVPPPAPAKLAAAPMPKPAPAPAPMADSGAIPSIRPAAQADEHFSFKNALKNPLFIRKPPEPIPGAPTPTITVEEPAMQPAPVMPKAAPIQPMQKPATPPTSPAPKAVVMPQNAPAAKAADIPTLHTFKGDIEGTVQSKGLTMVGVAAAEAARAGRPVGGALLEPEAAPRKPIPWMRILEVVGGVVLIAGALGLIAFAYLNRDSLLPLSTGSSISSLPGSYIETDDTQLISIPADTPPALIRQGFRQFADNAKLSLGLMLRFFVVNPVTGSTTSSGATPMSAQDFLALIAPEAPQELTRALAPDFMLGVHAFDGNQPFLIFKTDSYAQAFAGMLSWEETMQQDLTPPFTRQVSPHLSGAGQGTSTPSAPETQILNTPFRDRVVGNHDARVIQNQYGDILMLWTFLDRNTLVITTDENTLQEIISRLADAPVVPMPGN